jgi:hypothetical protein
MTKDEMKKALPEMVMFAKNEEERNHYKKLQSLSEAGDLEKLELEIEQHLSQFGQRYEQKSSPKTRRP